jgi:hypothetical protein
MEGWEIGSIGTSVGNSSLITKVFLRYWLLNFVIEASEMDKKMYR